jgi:putative AdoMet-dependent methyltransferase
MSRPEWYYDDLRQLGTDFGDAEQVAAYDRNQSRDPAADRALAASLRLDPSRSLLDLGCGTGQFACEAARLAREVVAVDVSPAMLAFARNRAGNEKLGNLRFIHAGFLSYEHEGAAVDVAVSKFALHHLPDFWKAVALRRMHGWIKPGGLLFLQDVAFSFPVWDYRRGVEEWIARMASPAGKGFTAGDFATHVREEHSTFRWILEGLIERAGFRIVARKSTDEAYAEFRCLRL